MTRSRAAGVTAFAIGVLCVAWLFMRPGSTARPPLPAHAPRQAPAASPDAAPPPSGLPIRLLAPAPAAPDDLPATFEGRVVSSATGQGVPGADLTFSRAGAAASVHAGADGAFTFAAPASGRWLLAAVTAPGYLPFAPEWGHSPVQLDARPGLHVRGVELHLTPATELAGRVVDERGGPVAGARVRLLGTSDEAALVPLADRFTSGPDGRFTFAAPEGAVLEAAAPGRLPGRAEVDALALANRRLTIALGPAHQPLGEPAAIAGKVVAKGGGPLEGALVAAAPEGPFGSGGAVTAQAVTGPGGEFSLRDLPPGAYRVTARADERAPASAHRVRPGGEPLLLELEAGGRLRGCVRDAASGAPVAPFTAFVYERRSALRLVLQRSVSVVDPGGCWALDDLTPGPAAVVVSAPRYAPTAELPVEIPPPGAEAVRDAALEPGGTLRGRVVDEATGRPLAGARLSVEGTLEGAASTFPSLAQATTGADGAFLLFGLPRRFSVFAAAEGHHARIVGGLETAPGDVKGPLEIRLRAVEPGEEPRTELAGVGLQLAAHGDALSVTGVLAGGGAAEMGIQRGDEILRVEGRPVTELGLAGAVQLIRGPEGTAVRLTVRRADVTRDLAVPRRLVRG
ncbi:MAG TPA: carboxypeptidase regulatory-like domain-containing protein [Anaeromyxobacteraceae bacterium]|nr:carboxypeptidase regulatory-like domain-containing protein [Anaeromyxobacteraceae bacterium]